MNYSHSIVIFFHIMTIAMSLPTIASMQQKKYQATLRLQKKLKETNPNAEVKKPTNIQINNDLIVACTENKFMTVSNLLNEGADPNYQIKIDGKIITPLLAACSHGHSEIASILIDHHADMFIRIQVNSNTLNPWLIACNNGYNDICKKMIKKDRSIIKTTNQKGISGLHMAIHDQKNSIAEIILEADTSKEIMHNLTLGNLTPLGLACSNNFYDSAALLLKYGAKPNKFHEKEMEPLFCAIAKNHAKIVELLITHNIDVNAKMGQTTALNYAACMGNATIGQLLIDNKVTFNNEDSPLFYALMNERIDFLKMLLENNIRPADYFILFSLIEKVNNEEITNLFKSYGIECPSAEQITAQILSFFKLLNESTSAIKNDCIDIKPVLENTDKNITQEKPITTRAPKKVYSTTPKKTSVKSNQSRPHEDAKYEICQAKNIKWPKGLSDKLLQKIRCHIKELAYYCPDKTPSNITKLKGIDNGCRLRIGDIRIIFSYDHPHKKVYIQD